MTLPAHFKRVPAPVPVLVGVGAIAGTFLITYPLAASSLSEHPMRLPRVFLSASISWEPSETVGDFLLSLSVVPVSFAIVARKLELDLRRAQLPRKEAPVGHVPAVFDKSGGVEFWAFAANVASLIAAAGRAPRDRTSIEPSTSSSSFSTSPRQSPPCVTPWWITAWETPATPPRDVFDWRPPSRRRR